MSGKHPKFGIHEKSVVKSSFDSKEEFLDTVLASCLVPYWAGTIPVTMNDVNYYDGGFTGRKSNLIEFLYCQRQFTGHLSLENCSSSAIFDLIERC